MSMIRRKNEGIEQSHKKAIVIASIFIVCLIVTLNIFLGDALFVQGINFIYDYQRAQPSPIIHFIQNCFSFMCKEMGVGIVFIMYYILVNRKLMLLVHISYFFMGIYFIAILKQIFQQSRPIWYSDQIEDWEWFCPKDFGNPSGHSFGTVMLYEPIVSDQLGFGSFNQGWVFLAVISVMIPVSRMYLGVHSANQILMGLCLGFAFCVAFHYGYQKALYRFYWDLLVRVRRMIIVIGIIVLNVVVIVIPIIIFIINSNERPMAEQDLTNMNAICGTELTSLEVQFHILKGCSLGCIGFGFCYGFLALSSKPGYKKYLLGMWEHQSFLKVLLKILVYVFFCFFPAGVFVVLGNFVIKQQIVAYLFFCIGTLLIGFGLSYFAPLVSLKFNIIRLLPEEDGDYDDESLEQ